MVQMKETLKLSEISDWVTEWGGVDPSTVGMTMINNGCILIDEACLLTNQSSYYGPMQQFIMSACGREAPDLTYVSGNFRKGSYIMGWFVWEAVSTRSSLFDVGERYGLTRHMMTNSPLGDLPAKKWHQSF